MWESNLRAADYEAVADPASAHTVAV